MLDAIHHLWQSTLFAAAAGLLTLAFRHYRARVRYTIWLAASCKFLFPFALLMSLGSQVHWTRPVALSTTVLSTVAVEVIEPFSSSPPLPPVAAPSFDWPLALAAVWAAGFLAIVLVRFRAWSRVRAAVRASTRVEIAAGFEVRCAPGLLEPGVVGLVHPVLLLPAEITARLTPRQLEAVLAHERAHIQKRDNCTSALHMAVEALFWFHPLVWWIGARLVEERERACDEAVLSQGNAPREYADAIVGVCRLYVESPLACVAGVTGADLKRRIHAILSGRVARDLSFARKTALAAAALAAVAAPFAIGMLPRARAQSSAAAPKFEVVSIKPCKEDTLPNGGGRGHSSPGRLSTGCTTVAFPGSRRV